MRIFSFIYYTFVHYKYLIVYSTDYDNPVSIANSSDALAFVSITCNYLLPYAVTPYVTNIPYRIKIWRKLV